MKQLGENRGKNYSYNLLGATMCAKCGTDFVSLFWAKFHGWIFNHNIHG